MSVLRGCGLSLKPDFIRDRFLHSPCTHIGRRAGSRGSSASSYPPSACGLAVLNSEEAAQTPGSCWQFSAFQPPNTSLGEVFLTILQDNVDMSTPHNLGAIKRTITPPPWLQALVVRGNSESYSGAAGPGFKAISPPGLDSAGMDQRVW